MANKTQGNLVNLSKRASVPFVKQQPVNSPPAPFLKTPTTTTTTTTTNAQEEKNYIIEIILDSARESTTHGIDHMFKRTNRCIQFMWLFFFLASTATCAYYISQSIITYLSFDTVTKAEQVYVVSTQFPAVSICNINPYLTNVSYEFVKNVLVKNNLISPTDYENVFNYYFDDALETFKFLVGFNSLDSSLTDDYRKQFGYEMKDMLLSCIYNLNNCTADDFYWYYDMQFGNCYIFNSGKYANGSSAPILNSTKSSSLSGLMIELFLYEPTNVLSLSSKTGVHITVFNQTNKPQFYDGVLAATGSQADIQIQRVFSYHLEQPYSDCITTINMDYPSKYVRSILATGYAYSQELCFLACYQKYAIEKCSCYNIYIQKSTGIPFVNETNFKPCLTFATMLCDSQMFSSFFSQDVEPICGQECPLECTSVKYNIYKSDSEYPSQIYATSLMNNPIIKSKFVNQSANLTYDALKRTMVQLMVYYEDLGYQQYDEVQKMSLSDLVANIGGLLGLFLGMSFLSFVEILDIFLQIFFYKQPSPFKDRVVPYTT